MVQAQWCRHSLSLAPAPSLLGSQLLDGYRYHITTPEGLMITVKFVLSWRPLMISPV